MNLVLEKVPEAQAADSTGYEEWAITDPTPKEKESPCIALEAGGAVQLGRNRKIQLGPGTLMEITTPTSDIDTVVLVSDVKRSVYMKRVQKVLTEMEPFRSHCDDFSLLADSLVPYIKCSYRGYPVDVQFAVMPGSVLKECHEAIQAKVAAEGSPRSPESIPGLRAAALSSILDRVCTAGLLGPEGSAAADWSNSLVDDATIRSLNGVRVGRYLLEKTPVLPVYRVVLRFVKMWAKARGM
ncbi:hypothetical protein FOZ62_030656 [Perkinsus olseni]|uniref:Uncharacterized protein n=1 Tax=Perkinsus olseni TaxID=32597 RepID=A0A7J6R8Y7_PEROL|nr:hypothetical protein FOZ62_030656 [Perkinsus olseni]